MRREKHLPQDSRAQQQEVDKGDKAGAPPGAEFRDCCNTSTCRAPLGNRNPAQNNCIHPSRPRKEKILPSRTWLFLQPEASFLPSGDQAMLSTQCR